MSTEFQFQAEAVADGQLVNPSQYFEIKVTYLQNIDVIILYLVQQHFYDQKLTYLAPEASMISAHCSGSNSSFVNIGAKSS